MFSISEVIEQAKEILYREGILHPRVHLYLTDYDFEVNLDALNDHMDIAFQVGFCGKKGWELCKEFPGQKPIGAYWYGEAWVVKEPVSDLQLKLNPNRSPNKKEVISLMFWEVAPHTLQYYELPILRDKKKRLIGLGSIEGPTNNITYQFASFLMGVLDSQKPDEEVFARHKKKIEEAKKRLSPEKLQEFEKYIQGMQF